jgi:hypothetical protein
MDRVGPFTSLARALALSLYFPLLCVAATSSSAAWPAGSSRGGSFEEEARAGVAPLYTWKNHGIVALLDFAGRMTIRAPGLRKTEIDFVGASHARPEGQKPVGYRTYYYLGARSQWHSSSGFERVRYRDIYPGIDLIFSASENRLEYDFELRPEADYRQIRIRYSGAAVRLDVDRNVQIGEGADRLKQRRPVAFQGDGAEPHFVACNYLLLDNELTLQVGPYDPSRPLVIDPVLQFSSYLGGSSFDATYALTTDSEGNVYITGETGGSVNGASEPDFTGRAVWIAKLNASASQILYLAYMGGSGDDAGKGIAVDSSGNAYVTGYAGSLNFPATSGALSTTNNGTPDAFVAKLDSSGQLQYSTFLGGAGANYGFAIGVDATGAAYVAGQTSSSSFPVTSNIVQGTNHGGISDCFVSKLNSSGSALVYSTYLGGSGLDLCAGLALDGSGDVYVTGTTASSNFPTQLPIQSNLLGSQTAFVAEINPSGSALVYATFLGGSVLDNGNAIAVDSTGAAYVGGATASPDFPTTVAVFQTALNGTANGFVAKLAPAGSGLVYSTLLGGSSSDRVTSLVVDGASQAVLAGSTSSTNFPLVSATQPVYAGSGDAFAAVLSDSGGTLLFSTYLGGSGADLANAVAVFPGNQMYIAGATSSANFPALAAVQNSLGGGTNAFLANIKYADSFVLVPIAPCRVADTREGQPFSGAFGPPFITGGTARNFPVPSSACGVPSTAQAYSLNFTAFPRTSSLEFLTVWPTNGPFPNASTLNSLDGRWVANAAILPAGAGGAISVYASDDTDLAIDINGYFENPSNPEGLSFYALTPCRIADTRVGQGQTGPFGPPFMAGGATRSFPIPASSCAVPNVAQVYSLNITALPRTRDLGFLTIWGTGNPFPSVSTLNSITGIVVANAAIVPAGSGGAVSVYVTDDTDLIIDINGYFAPSGHVGALQFYPVNPCRIADTRTTQGKVGAFGPPTIAGGTVRTLPVPLSGCPAPVWAGAYDLNITALPSGYLGWVTVWPAGQPEPVASTLNSLTGTAVANMAVVPTGTGGGIDVFASNTTDILVDLNGYFGP